MEKKNSLEEETETWKNAW